jgi:hypothetical protein
MVATLSHRFTGPFHVQAMPCTKEGDGPASFEDTAFTKYNVLDANLVELCSCSEGADAEFVKDACNTAFARFSTTLPADHPVNAESMVSRVG